MNRIILVIILISLILASTKDVDIFSEFMDGVKEGMKLVLTIFPTLMAFYLWVVCFQYCGITNIIETILKPLMTFLNIPIEILMMMILKPFSSNGSLTLLNNIYLQYGVDHPYSILASIIQTGSDTTFYVVSLYFGSVKIKNNRYSLKLGLALDTIACLMAIIFYLIYISN